MLSLHYPAQRIWFICLDADDTVVASGYVDPEQTMDSGAATLLTYTTEAAYLIGLIAQGIADTTEATP